MIQIPIAFKDLFWWQHNAKSPNRFFLYYGGRASGKSTTVGLSLLLRASITTIRVLCAREYQNSLDESVKQLLTDLITENSLPNFKITKDAIINLRTNSSFIFKGLHNNIQSLKSTEGVDVCWVEEAQTITSESLEILIPTIRKPDSTLIFTWNPYTHEDPIWRRFITKPRKDEIQRTLIKKTTWKDLARLNLLNSTILGDIFAAQHTAEYAHTWLGEPYEKTSNQVIKWDDLDAATKRTADIQGGVIFGVDIARYGNDRTALAVKQGNHLESITPWNYSSIPDTVARIEREADKWKPTAINVDDTGVGGGVTDLLRKDGYPVVPINYAAKPKAVEKYPNIASELWFDFGDRINQITINPSIDITPELFEELSTRDWSINSRGLRQIQSKKDYKGSQDHRSPDLADSVLLAFYEPPTVALQWARG